MDQDRDPQPAGRCTAAHIEDPTACRGPHDAVTILDGACIEPGSVVGAATRAAAASQTIRPFCWYEDAPRTEPSQLSHAENARRA